MLIGLSVNHKEGLSCISNAYVQAVIKAGGSPVLIPLTNDARVLDELLDRIDGLVLSGGGDLDASFFGETLHPSVEAVDTERDRYDIALVQKAVARQMPVFGICRGQQVVNVALGGNLIQDIPSALPHATINHSQAEPRDVGTHAVRVVEDSLLHRLVGREELMVNSFHHQAVKDLAAGFVVSAQSADGVCEAIESDEGKAILGVQWHPENMAVADNQTMVNLFRYLVDEADRYRRAVEIHRQHYIIDSHSDTPMFLVKGADLRQKNEETQYDLPKMEEGMVDAVFMVAYLKQGARDDKTLEATVEKTFATLDEIQKQVDRNLDKVGIASSFTDLRTLKSERRKAIFLGVENGYGIGKDLTNLQRLFDRGVRYITLSHNGDNDICDAALQSNREHNGLSDFGRDVVREMNRLGIMVDLSHTSEKTSFDVLEVSASPVIASHSNAKGLCNHPRNISDELMRAIAQRGGVIQICLYPPFLNRTDRARVQEAVDHIDYIVRLVGVDHVGIGSDFDGGGGITGAASANELMQLTLELLRRDYSKEEIAKIWGGNLMRVMEENRRLSQQ